jgi:amino acid transporter
MAVRDPAAGDAAVPTSAETGGLFVRRSSGLVRAFSAWDGFIYAVYADSIVAAAALTYAVGSSFNQANLPLAIVVICLALVPAFTVYAMLTNLMPRAGGDYVWQSRVLGGVWAFLLCLGPLVIGPWFYMASNVSPGATLATAPLFASLADLFNAQWPLNVAEWVVTTDGQFVFYLGYLLFGAVVVGLGMRFYARFQRWSFYLGCAGLATWFLILLTTSHSEFVSSFNAFFQNTLGWGDGQAYDRILASARENGYDPVALGDTSLKDTLLIGPVLAYVFLFVAWTANMAGEISGVGDFKRSLRMYLGANFFAMVVCALFVWLLIDRVSNEFFTAANFEAINGNTDIPITPLYSTFLVSMSGSPLLGLWVMLAFSAWFWIWPTNNYVGTTRFMFAMSFDRMLPAGLSRVVGRTGTPIVALAVAFVGMAIFGYLYWYTSFADLTLALPLFATVAFAGTCLAGTLLPFLPSTRRVYAASVLSKYRVGPVPLITVMGTLSLAYFAFLLVRYFSDDRYGVNGTTGLLFALGLGVFAVALYAVMRVLRRRQGIDVTQTYREIPAD